MRDRAELFSYVGLEITGNALIANYRLDDEVFREVVTFEGVDRLDTPAIAAVAALWYLVAGLSYYKAGAARRVDLGDTPVGPHGRALFHAALIDGLGEFSYRNELPLDDVIVSGGTDTAHFSPYVDANRILTPFGGGIDSVVTVTELNPQLDQALFIVSPASGRFEPLEATAQVTGFEVVRATRSLDPLILRGGDHFNGHVPVTTMVNLLAVIAALATGRGGVAMSNEHSASVPNLRWAGRDVNHQWSKSWIAEELIAAAIEEVIGRQFDAASFLRDRSELWVASIFSSHREFHHVFRSCNRAFAQQRDARAAAWCGQCDKCLFINLILAPFLSRRDLRAIFPSAPLTDPALHEQLRTLVGCGLDFKPFECVGDPDESAVALTAVSEMPEWADAAKLAELARLVSPDREFNELLQPQGPSRVPAHWLR